MDYSGVSVGLIMEIVKGSQSDLHRTTLKPTVPWIFGFTVLLVKLHTPKNMKKVFR